MSLDGGIGATIFGPHVGTNEATLFTSLDPVVDRLLGLFSTAINQELGWSTASVDANSPWGAARVGTSLSASQPVSSTLWNEPDPAYLREGRSSFPILAVYRTEWTDDEFTEDVDRVVCQWNVDYVLGPLSPEDRRKLYPAMDAAHKIIRIAIYKRSHPSYDSGALQFGTDKGNLSSIRLVSGRQGNATFGGESEGNVILANRMVMETVELYSPASTEGDFEGTTLSLGNRTPQGIIPDFIEAYSDPFSEDPA